MGNTWEVLAWQEIDNPYNRDDLEFERVEVYRGESMLRAIWEAIKAKRTCGCVTIYWRS